MKRSVFAALMLGSVITPSFAYAGDPVAATVNGKDIKVSDVMAEMKGLELGKDAPQEQIFNLVRNRKVDLEVIIQAAQKAGLKDDPEVKKALEKFLERLLVQYLVAQEMKKTVTDAAVQEEYKKLSPQKQVKLSHILLKDESTAKAVIKALKSGTDFATLAKSKSIDKETGKKGGELGVSLESKLPPPFDAAVKDLTPGNYTQTPVKTPMGSHVILLVSRTDAPFEDVAPVAREKLEKEAITKLIETLKKDAKIELFDQEGKPVKAEAAPAA